MGGVDETISIRCWFGGPDADRHGFGPGRYRSGRLVHNEGASNGSRTAAAAAASASGRQGQGADSRQGQSAGRHESILGPCSSNLDASLAWRSWVPSDGNEMG